MYKVGEKVNYEDLVWEITCIDYRDNGVIDVEIYNAKLGVNIWVVSDVLEPYVSAHDKMLGLGWEEKIHDIDVKRDVESGRYKQYVKGSEVILIDIEDKEFTTYILYNGSKGVDDVSWVNLTLSRILTQYLEELEAKEE